VLQICLYSDLLETIQGAQPEFMYIVPPRDDFSPDVYRVDDFLAYYRLVRRRLEEAVDSALPRTAPCQPTPTRCPLRHLPLVARLRPAAPR